MVSWVDIVRESEDCGEKPGEDFYRNLGNSIHEGMLELQRQRRERRVRLNEAYARNLNLQVTI